MSTLPHSILLIFMPASLIFILLLTILFFLLDWQMHCQPASTVLCDYRLTRKQTAYKDIDCYIKQLA
jgi:short subunit fatty acids transporter